MGDQGYYDQKFGLPPACIEDVLQIPFFLLRFNNFSPTQKDVGNFDPGDKGFIFSSETNRSDVQVEAQGSKARATLF